MTNLIDEVTGRARDLVRSLWSELGVDVGAARHDWQAIDLEPLIVFTAMCADARMREKTVAWCAANRHLLSLPRLNRLAIRVGESANKALEPYIAALQGVAAADLQEATTKPDMRVPSLIQLRLRALAGVTARAEVLMALLAEPLRAKSPASIAARVGYGRHALAQALDMLTLAGVTSTHIAGKSVLYRLNRPSDLGQALSGLPGRFPDWVATFAVLGAILTYAREPARKAGAAVERIRADIARIPGATPPPEVTDDASAGAFEQWARRFVADIAGVEPERSTRREVTYTVHRLALGGWIGTVKEEGGQPRPLALSDDPELHPERRATRRLNSDELGAAAEVIDSILYDMQTRELQRHRGSLVPRDAVSGSLLPGMSREFAGQLLQPLHRGQAATFSADFLQRWCTDHRNRLGAAS
ncbi:MAG TPA: hypothetical protein VFB69_02065 [Candidatus Dormibacteraeota bacterium]|nr:hypothetical protein [Candidatus Dormibacteraeota bacterium]